MSNVDELVASARTAMEAGDTLLARGYLRRAARTAPDRLDIWIDLLGKLLQKGIHNFPINVGGS